MEIFIVTCKYKDKDNNFTEIDSCWDDETIAYNRKAELLRIKEKGFQYLENYLQKNDSILTLMIMNIKKLEILEEVEVVTQFLIKKEYEQLNEKEYPTI